MIGHLAAQDTSKFFRGHIRPLHHPACLNKVRRAHNTGKVALRFTAGLKQEWYIQHDKALSPCPRRLEKART